MNVLISHSDHDFAILIQNMISTDLSNDTIEIFPQDDDIFAKDLSRYKLLIVDDSIPIFQLLSKIQKLQMLASPALIFLFDPASPEMGKTAIQAGIHYALPKSHDLLNILPALARNAVKIHNDQEKIKLLCRQLEEADKAAFIGRLSAGLAHDFNNILHIINSHAQAAQDFPGEDAKNASFDIIRDCCDQGQSISQQLTNLLKPRQIHKSRCSIEQLIETALQFMHYGLQRHKINIIKDFQDVPKIECNEEQVLQIILNVLDKVQNAVKEVGCTLKISTQRDGQIVITRFEENSKSNNGSAFIETEITAKSDKNEIGLFVSKNIAQQHNGFLEIEKQENFGEIFTLTLPISAQQINPIPRHAPTEPAAETPRLNILVVEDEELIRSVLKSLLSLEGHNVTLVENGEEGLEQLANKSFDLVLTDLNMPRMHGLQFLEKAMQRYRELNVVMITGDSFNEELEYAEQLGSIGYLLKPFRKNELDAVIQKVSQMKEIV